MKININYVNINYFNITDFHQWLWRWKPYKGCKGIIIRICGISFNIREKDATKKLIARYLEEKEKREKHFKEGTLKEYVKLKNK